MQEADEHEVTADALLDELWGVLCPDIGQADWREAVKALAAGKTVRWPQPVGEHVI